jgi:hypothetical protein
MEKWVSFSFPAFAILAFLMLFVARPASAGDQVALGCGRRLRHREGITGPGPARPAARRRAGYISKEPSWAPGIAFRPTRTFAMATSSEPAEGISLQDIILQFSLMCLVFYLWSSPLIQPIKLMVVLFHEMSHGFMALATGGKVLAIEITADEGGSCETEGGIALLIVGAGYLGSMLFGGTLLCLSRQRAYVPVVYGILALTLGAAFCTVLRDSYSRTFASALAGTFVVLGFLSPAFLGGFVLRLLGTVSCLYSIFDIYWDVLADRGGAAVPNDAIVFAELAGMTPQAVGMAWLVASVLFFLVVLKVTLAAGPASRPAPAAVKQA